MKVNNFFLSFSDESARKKCISISGSVAYKLFRLMLLASMCFVIIYPIIYMVSVAIRESIDLYDPTVIWIPKNFTLDNFKSAIDTLDYWRLFGNTLLISVVGTFLNVSSCALAGYGFARFNFKLKEIFFMLVMFMIIIPPQVISIPLYLQYSNFDFLGIGLLLDLISGLNTSVNLLDTHFTIYIPAMLGCGLRSGFLIFMFRQFFRSMPAALEDAAYIDGCGTIKSFFKIIIPNATGSFLVASILSFVWYYNDYFFTSMYFNKVTTLSVGLTALKGTLALMSEVDTRSDPYSIITQLQAGCLLVILPLIIVFFFLQRKFIKSVESSGIVG